MVVQEVPLQIQSAIEKGEGLGLIIHMHVRWSNQIGEVVQYIHDGVELKIFPGTDAQRQMDYLKGWYDCIKRNGLNNVDFPAENPYD